MNRFRVRESWRNIFEWTGIDLKFAGAGKLGNGRRPHFKIILSDKLKMSNFQDNPSVGGSVNKIDGEMLTNSFQS